MMTGPGNRAFLIPRLMSMAMPLPILVTSGSGLLPFLSFLHPPAFSLGGQVDNKVTVSTETILKAKRKLDRKLIKLVLISTVLSFTALVLFVVAFVLGQQHQLTPFLRYAGWFALGASGALIYARYLIDPRG
jgi:hypothetical protein